MTARIAILLAALSAAAAIAAAPSALAEPSCDQAVHGGQQADVGTCESTGDTHIDAGWPDIMPPGYWGGGTDGFHVE
ncbi:hypothetical protein JDV09_17030 [Mycobacterium sp. Y57]|uniref:hypothetical protein n=1 Tax=Mycolicibacterium xanthum TaxID=2796469 RepID=UPI001C85B9A8|nr:hypothetical protein [Mycolicibacterium xanthum]MBX7433798.1 hypothetical protein [Mycolicibacterium xanthum]